jgi:AraC family transcriptional regulator, regulatory protein of adaptative response / DNA-3-methyladenine glycosylase II
MSENGESAASRLASLRSMSLEANPTLPDPAVCEQARLSRDARFDGLFFTAVSSTGIYCRPVCPAPAPKRANVSYFASAAAAEAAGYRPCLRCRPELAPGEGSWRRGDSLLARALQRVEAGALAEASVADLAAELAIGERQLRRVFVERLGAAPLGVHSTRRLLFAKQLLTETALPITEVALAAGFNSLRRFNDAFLAAYRLPPSRLRQQPRGSAREILQLRLAYRPPYDFAALLEFLRDRALPGVEAVRPDSYARLLGTHEVPGWIRVSAWPGDEPALRLEVQGVASARLLDLVVRVRRMFDLDADPQAVAGVLAQDRLLARLVARRPGLRLPGAFDGFETAVRAVLGQQVSVAAARTLATRLVQRFGTTVDGAPLDALDRRFPTPDVLAEADLQAIGLTRQRAQTVRSLARAVAEGRVDFRRERGLDDFVARWTALPGIGEWTAHYLALRALGHPDAFPAADLVLRRVASVDAAPVSTREIQHRAEAWRPWRAYAAIQLWRSAANSEPEESEP